MATFVTTMSAVDLEKRLTITTVLAVVLGKYIRDMVRMRYAAKMMRSHTVVGQEMMVIVNMVVVAVEL